MQSGEIVGVEALLLEQRNGQGVTQSQRNGGAGGWSQIVRTRLLLHPRVERHIAVARESRVGVAGQRDCRYTKALQMIEQAEDFVGLAALRDEDGDVLVAHDSEVTVYAIGGMEECGGSPRRCESSGDFAADET